MRNFYLTTRASFIGVLFAFLFVSPAFASTQNGTSTCSGSLVTTVLSFTCVTQQDFPDSFLVSPASSSPDVATYRDWLIVVQWVVFILGFMLWGYIFSPFARHSSSRYNSH